jgi:uncharacterized protein with FMN-binding domain
MRRALFAISSTVVGLVMLLSFKSHAATVTTPPAAIATPVPGTADPTGAADPTGTADPSDTASPSGASATSGSGTKTVTGASADTRWGPVQVQITVTDGTVTAVTAVVYPQNNQRDVEINQFAIPQLNQEATAAKSSSIDFVSGATVTSQGYVQSLQSALDQAGL